MTHYLGGRSIPEARQAQELDHMASLDDVRGALRRYVDDFRKSGLEPLRISEAYDLLPDDAPATLGCRRRWPESYENPLSAGVYVVFDRLGQVIYVGKSSMNSSLSARLSSYFAFAPDRRCRIQNGGPWTAEYQPRFVMNIAVPDSMRWEAPALEEYLIAALNPPLNTLGRTT